MGDLIRLPVVSPEEARDLADMAIGGVGEALRVTGEILASAIRFEARPSVSSALGILAVTLEDAAREYRRVRLTRAGGERSYH